VSTILVTGGGSGGHVTPALAVADHLQNHGFDVVFVGSDSGLEQALVDPKGLRYVGISAGKLRRYFSFANLLDVFRVLLGIFQAIWIVRRERPEVVFSKGGFVAFPVVFAAWFWRIPVVAHESDATQGLANRLSAPFVNTLCTGFPDTQAGRFKGRFVYTGAPVRAELANGDAVAGRALVGAEVKQKVLLITGGSLGADALNACVVEALSDLLFEGWFVVHVCGEGKQRAEASSHYRAYDYVGDGWADMLAAADVVVSRAGANTVFELLTLGKPNLLVPLPATGSRGDQIDNAAYAARGGYSKVVSQSELNAKRLVAEVSALWADIDSVRTHLATFETTDAVKAIAQELFRFTRTPPQTVLDNNNDSKKTIGHNNAKD